MRTDTPVFGAYNAADSKEPRFVIRIAYPVDSLYITSHSGISGVPGTVLQAALEEPSIVSQRLNPIDGRSEIGSASFTVVDLGSDLTTAIRNRLVDNGLRGRQVSFWLGYAGLPFADFVLIGTQQVVEAAFDRGRYQIRCADIQRSAKKDIFALAETQLAQSVSATDTTIFVTSTTGFSRVYHGASYSDAPNATVGYVKIRDEVVRYTGTTATSFTGCTRGALGTLAAKYDVDAATPAARREKVTEHVYLELPAVKLAYAILTGALHGDAATLPATWHLGIDPALIRLADFTGIGPDLWDGADGGVVIRFEYLKKTDGKKFLEEEICRLLGCFAPVYADGALGFRRATRVLADAATVATLDESNSTQVGELVHDMGDLHNVFQIQWNWTGADFTRTTTLIDVASAAKHGRADPLDLKFKGLYGGRATDSLINQLVDSLRDRYAAPPERLSVEVLHSLNRLEVGDVVRVRYASVRDFAGATTSIDRSFEIQNISVNHRTGAVSLELFGSTSPASATSPTNATTAVPDTFYQGPGQTGGAGTALSSVATITGGVMAAGTYTLAGGPTLGASGSIWFHNGDLTIPQGTTLNISGNVQLRVRGFLTVNGAINGVGGGHPGTAEVASTTVLAGTPGFVGNSRGRDGIEVSQKGGNPVMRTIPAGITVGRNITFPYLDVAVVNSAVTGLPSDLRGTGGAPGGKVQFQGGFRAKGGDGGAGGAGLAVIARGFSTGAAALIDLSGANGGAGQFWDDEGKRWNAGGGGAGGPGAFLLLLDGATVSAPDLTNRLRCRTGTVPTPAPFDGKLKYLDVPGDQRYSLDDRNYAGWPDPAVISGQDLSFAAQRIQFIPAPETPATDADAAPPAILSLSAVAQDGYALVSWALPVDPASYDAVELWSSLTNSRGDATLVYDGRANEFQHVTGDTAARWYWVRSRRGRIRSAWFPVTTTSTVTVTARPPTLTGNLTNEAHVVAADAAGNVASFAGAVGTFKVFRGTVDVTTQCAFTVVTASSVTATIGAATGVYAVTAMSADAGFVTFRATFAGAYTLDKTFSITKARAGTNGAAGADGRRGAGVYWATVGATGTGYSLSAGDAAAWDGGTLTDAIAQEAAAFVIASSGTGFLEVRDALTISETGVRAGQRIYNGARTSNSASVTAADWSSKVVQTIDGSLIVTGTLSASTITTGTLNALRLNIDGLSLTNTGGQLSIASGGVTTTQIGNGAVTSGKVADGAVTTTKLADAAVDVAKFAAGVRPVEIVATLPSVGNIEGRTVYLTTDDKLYRWTGSAWTAAVPAADVTGTLADSQIAALAASKVTGQLSDAQLAAIAAAKITGQLTDAQLAAIASTKITGQLTNAQIADLAAAKLTGQITTTQITDNAVTTAKVNAAAITTAKIAANAVTADELAADAVTAAKISAGAVTTAKLAAGAVTANEIAANAITAAKISAGAIETAKIATGAITADTIASNAVTAAKITAGAVEAGKIATGAVDALTIAAGAVTTAKLAANAVTANEIAANAITSGKIAANAVTAGKVAAAAISTAELAANAVTTAKLAVVAPGAALNADPGMTDASAWSAYSGAATFTTITDGAVGNWVARSGAGVQAWMNEAKSFPVDPSKTYRVRCRARTVSGSGSTFYMGVAAFDATGANIAGDGSQWYYAVAGVSVPSAWTEYSATFGAGTAKTLPSNARTISPLFILAYGGGSSVHDIQDLRIEERVPASLIVDGAITAAKLEADLVLASTFKTAASGYRTEISNSGSYPIWYGTGTKNDTNGLFYVKTDGTVFFKGTVGTGSKIEVFTVTLPGITGTASGAAGTGNVTSAAASLTLTNGTASYTYLWEHLVTIGGETPTCSSTTAAGPTFSRTDVDGNQPSVSIWRITVTDSKGNVASAQAYVRLIWIDTR